MEFQDKVVMVTGAAGHLGQAVVRLFAERGAHVVLLARKMASLERAFSDDLPAEQMSLLAVDLLDQEQLQACVAEVIAQQKSIDVLCNIAGGFRMGAAVHETSEADFDFLLDVNVRTLLSSARAVVPRMLTQQKGKIVNIAAFSAQHGAAGQGAYIASKCAVMRLTETMSAELREQGINVNCVLPTILDTPANRQAMPDADPAKWVTPRALAEVIAFLASDAASAVHGAALPVTGLS